MSAARSTTRWLAAIGLLAGTVSVSSSTLGYGRTAFVGSIGRLSREGIGEYIMHRHMQRAQRKASKMSCNLIYCADICGEQGRDAVSAYSSGCIMGTTIRTIITRCVPIINVEAMSITTSHFVISPR